MVRGTMPRATTKMVTKTKSSGYAVSNQSTRLPKTSNMLNTEMSIPRMLVCVFFSSLLASFVNGQDVTRPVVGIERNVPEVFVLKCGTVIPAPGEKLENVSLVIRDGMICLLYTSPSPRD